MVNWAIVVVRAGQVAGTEQEFADDLTAGKDEILFE
jgi:hypothetical protein